MNVIKKHWKAYVAIVLGIIISLMLSNYILDVKKQTLSNIENEGYIILSIVITIIMLIVTIFIYNKKHLTEEKVFLYTVPIICILFIVVMPMFKSHDEHAHWHRIYEISTGQIATKVNQDGWVDVSLPKNVVCRDWVDMDYDEVIQDLYNKIDNSNTTNDVYIVTSSMYSPIQYVHEALAIAIARIIIKIPIILAYIGRIINLAVCVILMYFAIKKMPFGKKIVLCICYIPILMEGISSMSGDGITFASTLFFTAYVFNIVFNENIKEVTRKDKLILGIFSIIIASCKIVYLPFIGLLLLIPKEKMKNKKLTISITWGISILFSIIWLAYSGRYLGALSVYSKVGNVTTQDRIMSILTNPFGYIQRIIYEIEINGAKYLGEMFGSGIGWYNFVSLNTIVPYVLFIMFSSITLIDNSVKDRFSKFQKIIIALVLLAVFLLIFTSLYVQWTKADSNGIDGIQGRYFIPLLPMFGMLLGSCIKVRNKYKEQNMIKFIAIVGFILQMQFILTTYICNI